MKKYSAEWVRDQVRSANAYKLDHHECSLCGVMVRYGFNPPGTEPEVYFRSMCGCSYSPDRPATWDDVADWLNMQSSDEIRERIWHGLHSREGNGNG